MKTQQLSPMLLTTGIASAIPKPPQGGLAAKRQATFKK
jgi:hypothetical protein